MEKTTGDIIMRTPPHVPRPEMFVLKPNFSTGTFSWLMLAETFVTICIHKQHIKMDEETLIYIILT